MTMIALREGVTATVWANPMGIDMRLAGIDDDGHPFQLNIGSDEWQQLEQLIAKERTGHE